MATGALLLALVSEGYDLQAANFAAPALVTSLGIAKADLRPLLSASLLGVLFGAALIGSLGDRLGRKRLIIGGCLAYGLLSLAAAACNVLWELDDSLARSNAFQEDLRSYKLVFPPAKPAA